MNPFDAFTNPLFFASFALASTLLLTELALALWFMRYPPKPRRGLDRFVLGLHFATPVIIAVSMAIVVQLARQDFVRALRPTDPSQVAPLLGLCRGLCLSHLQLMWGGLLLAAAGILGALCVSLYWRKTRPDPKARRFVRFLSWGFGLALAAFGAGVLANRLSLWREWSILAGIDPALKLTMTAVATKEAMVLARIGLFSAMGIIAATALVLPRLWRAGSGATIGRGPLIGSIMLLLAGATALALTRGHCRDATRALPSRSPMHANPTRQIVLPTLVNGAPLQYDLQISISRPEEDAVGGIVTLENREIATVRELLSLENPWQPIPRLSERLAKHRLRWNRANPGKTGFDGIILSAHKRTPSKLLSHIFRTAKDAGFSRFHLATAKSITVTSEVLGDFRNSFRYGVTIVVKSKGGRPLSLDRPYQHLATQADILAGKGETLTIKVGE